MNIPNERLSSEWYAIRSTHLEYCKENYADAISKFGGSPSDMPGEDLISKAVSSKDNPELQRQLCEAAIRAGALSAWPYERLAILYTKAKCKHDARKVCVYYFQDEKRWRTPN